MPTPRAPSVVAVTADNIVSGHKIVVRNLTSGGKVTSEMNDKGQIIVDLANVSDWQAGDVIVAERRGRYIGAASHTIETGKNPPKLSLTTTADARPSITL